MQLVKKNFLDSGIHLAISWPSIDISAHIGLRLCHHDLEPGEKPTTLENKFPTARRATTRITENMKPLVIYQSNRKFRVVTLQLDKNFWGKSHWWTFTTTNPHKVPEKKVGRNVPLVLWFFRTVSLFLRENPIHQSDMPNSDIHRIRCIRVICYFQGGFFESFVAFIYWDTTNPNWNDLRRRFSFFFSISYLQKIQSSKIASFYLHHLETPGFHHIFLTRVMSHDDPIHPNPPNRHLGNGSDKGRLQFDWSTWIMRIGTRLGVLTGFCWMVHGGVLEKCSWFVGVCSPPL